MSDALVQWMLIIWISTGHGSGVTMSQPATFQDKAACEEAGKEWAARSGGSGLLFDYYCMRYWPTAEKEFPK